MAKNPKTVEHDRAEEFSLWESLKNSWPVLVSCVYLLLCFIGILFNYYLYKDFNLNYFDYADITDFLLAGLKAIPNVLPVVAKSAFYFIVEKILYFMLGIILINVVINTLFSPIKNVLNIIFDMIINFSIFFIKTIQRIIMLIFSVVSIIIFLISDNIGALKAEQLKTNNEENVCVTLSTFAKSAQKEVSREKLHLIGTTEKFVILFKKNEQNDEQTTEQTYKHQTVVIPVSMISSITVPYASPEDANSEGASCPTINSQESGDAKIHSKLGDMHKTLNEMQSESEKMHHDMIAKLDGFPPGESCLGNQQKLEYLGKLKFDSDQRTLDAIADREKNHLINLINQQHDNMHTLMIVGFADRVGDLAYNRDLSFDRAKAVRDFLIANLDGAVAERIIAGSVYGGGEELAPIVTGDEVPEAENRSVHVFKNKSAETCGL